MIMMTMISPFGQLGLLAILGFWKHVQVVAALGHNDKIK
jgi:hypothetical protein